MNLKQKDLTLLPYPFTDQTGSKVRPAIIISNNIFNTKCQDFIMVPLTTVIKDEPYSMVLRQENLESGRLLKPSRLRIDKIFTINKSIVLIKVGKITDETLEKIKSELIKIF